MYKKIIIIYNIKLDIKSFFKITFIIKFVRIIILRPLTNI